MNNFCLIPWKVIDSQSLDKWSDSVQGNFTCMFSGGRTQPIEGYSTGNVDLIWMENEENTVRTPALCMFNSCNLPFHFNYSALNSSNRQ